MILFFFEQKTAYEMRISDWSSDVCSSDIEGVEENSDAVAVIEAVVTLGRRLGLEIVAEGIENEAQAKLMKEVGCTHLQGWFVARPLESSGVGQMLDTSPRVEPIVRMLREIGRAHVCTPVTNAHLV